MVPNELGAARVLVWVRDDTIHPLSGRLAASLYASDGAVLGIATGDVRDLQPREMRLIALFTAAPSAAVAGLAFRVTHVEPGAATPARPRRRGCSSARRAWTSPSPIASSSVSATAAPHEVVVSVARIDQEGGILGLVTGGWTHLAAGEERIVSIEGEPGLPVAAPGERFRPQLDAVR